MGRVSICVNEDILKMLLTIKCPHCPQLTYLTSSSSARVPSAFHQWAICRSWSQDMVLKKVLQLSTSCMWRTSEVFVSTIHSSIHEMWLRKLKWCWDCHMTLKQSEITMTLLWPYTPLNPSTRNGKPKAHKAPRTPRARVWFIPTSWGAMDFTPALWTRIYWWMLTPGTESFTVRVRHVDDIRTRTRRRPTDRFKCGWSFWRSQPLRWEG